MRGHRSQGYSFGRGEIVDSCAFAQGKRRRGRRDSVMESVTPYRMENRCCMKNKIIYVILFFFCLSGTSQTLQAREAYCPPHLIQTVNDQDIYEGLVALGLLECSTLDEEDSSQAYEMVKDCVVRVNMGNAYGSGVIWQLTEDAVIVATNAHVLAYWDDMTGVLHFPQGYYLNASVLGISESYDVGFLRVDIEALGYEQLGTLRFVSADAEIYERLETGDAMFSVGTGMAIGAVEYHEGTVEEPWQYIEEFENDMLYGYGYARTGMSGGGVFDGYGHFIGMLTGGTQRNEIAAVPLPCVVEAWEEVMEKEGADGTGR